MFSKYKHAITSKEKTHKGSFQTFFYFSLLKTALLSFIHDHVHVVFLTHQCQSYEARTLLNIKSKNSPLLWEMIYIMIFVIL